MTSTKQEIQEFRKYLKNPEQVKFDILQQDQVIRQRIKENTLKRHSTSGFNRPDAFSLEDVCDKKLIPTNYCWDADTKKIIGYPNRLLYGYPITCKNPRFITFLDINPNHDKDYQNQIESIYDNLEDEDITLFTNTFDFDELISISNLDKIVQNVIIPGFLKTLNIAEQMLNSEKMSSPDLFVTHNYSVRDLYEQLSNKKDVDQFLKYIFYPFRMFLSTNDFLCHNGLVFNCNDLIFIHSLVNKNINKLTDLCIYDIVYSLLNIFVKNFYQKTRYAYNKSDKKQIEDWLNSLNNNIEFC